MKINQLHDLPKMFEQKTDEKKKTKNEKQTKSMHTHRLLRV